MSLLLTLPRTPIYTLFPYTTLFRSDSARPAPRGIDRRSLSRESQTAGPAHRRAASRFGHQDRKSTRLNSSHVSISYAVFSLKKKTQSSDCIAQLNTGP